MSRRKPEDPLEKSLREHRVLEGHVLLQRLQIHFALVSGIFQNALDLGAINKTSPCLRIIKRLDAKHIAGTEKLLFPGIPDHKGKHSAQPVKDLHTVLTVPVQQDLRIRPGPEAVSSALELLPQFTIVINFPVKSDDQPAVFSTHRLIPALKINDRQASEAHRDLIVHILPCTVRSPVNDPVHHIGQHLPPVNILTGKSANSTHRNHLLKIDNSSISVHFFSGFLHYHIHQGFQGGCGINPLF